MYEHFLTLIFLMASGSRLRAVRQCLGVYDSDSVSSPSARRRRGHTGEFFEPVYCVFGGEKYVFVKWQV